jgi:hypothetical protein
VALAGAVALTVTLSAPTGAGWVLAGAGLALLVVPRTVALTVALAVLAAAAAVAIDQGATPAAAPLWGAGLLVAGGLAERALLLPADGELEAEALVAWLAALAALAGGGLVVGALVLLAGSADTGAPAVGLVGAALLAGFPVLLARRGRRRRDAG